MGKINVDYDVLNQKGSPAWYSDIFANIPTPGYAGRMFISTDTFAFYRDNGISWDLTGGPGIGTITGSGVIGQVSFFSGTQVLSGNSNLFWDNTNNRLGINTITPTTSLDIHTTGNAAIFNGTGTNNAFLTFANAGVNKWYIGNNYNAAANDYQIYDVLNSTARLTIKNTGDSTLIGTFTATSLIKSGGTNLQILLADGSTTPTSTFGAGSVTNVSALTLGTSGTDLTSSVANSTTTPVITLNVPTASATNRGALSSADWTTFNNKQATITLTTTGTSGAATLVGATLNVPNYTNVGTVTSVAALTIGTSGTDLSSTVANSTSTPVITLNVPTASATNRGALSSADFTTFNNKQATISVTAPVVLTGATISMPAATTSVNGYLTSTDWNTFNNKSNTNGTVTSVVALTIGTTGIDITSTAVTTTTTPVITLNIPTASASNRGALSSTDWTTFNNKQATLSLTTTGTSGVATLVANTLNVPNYGSALSGYLPLTGGTLTGPLGGTSASFSSSVTATSFEVGNGQFYNARRSSGNLLINLLGIESGTDNTRILITNDFNIVNGSLVSQFKIDSIGDASFVSSVAIANAKYFQARRSSGNALINVLGFETDDLIQVFSNSWKLRGTGGIGDEKITVLSNGAATFSSSVTAGGAFISSMGNSTQIFLSNSATTGYQYATISNTGANLNFGIERSTGGALSNGSLAYASLIQTSNSTALQFGTNNNIRATIDSTGNVGIGTASPTDSIIGSGTFLDIAGTGGGALKLHYTNATAYGEFSFYKGSNGSYIDSAGAATVANNDLIFRTGGTVSNYGVTERMRITSGGILNVVSRGNFLNSTDNALFSLNSGGTLYTVGFSPTATASSTNTFTITNGTTTWIYTGSGAATWTLPNPSGNNQIYWIKNAGTGAITLTAFSGTNIIDNSAASVSTISIAVGATAVIAQDGNVKSYQLQ